MECVNIATFTFATWQMRSCLLCKFVSPGGCLFRIFCIFRQENRIVQLFSIEQIQRSEGKWIICKPSKERVTTCKDYVIGREITTKLKIAVNKDVAAFTFAAWQIRSCLLFKFISRAKVRLVGCVPFVRINWLGWPFNNGKDFSKICKAAKRLMRDWKLENLRNGKEVSVVQLWTEKEE